jgi:hypothetical protein
MIMTPSVSLRTWSASALDRVLILDLLPLAPLGDSLGVDAEFLA